MTGITLFLDSKKINFYKNPSLEIKVMPFYFNVPLQLLLGCVKQCELNDNIDKLCVLTLKKTMV